MSRKAPPMPPLSERAPSGVPPVTMPTLPPQPCRRRRGLLALGVLVVAGGGLLASHVVAQLDDRVPVVVIVRDVPTGQRITKQDVATAMVRAEETVATVPAHELDQVVDMTAAVDLKSGMLVQSKTITDEMRPTAGEQLVPVALKPSRLPARGLQPGDTVLVVLLTDDQSGPTATTRSSTSTGIAATVDRVTDAADTDGLVVVDLIVGSSQGSQLATHAAQDQVALVLTPRSS
jgi:hypothetical protein